MAELTPTASPTELILERALAIGQGDIGGMHPMVLSCGGICVPRPRFPIARPPVPPLVHTPHPGQTARITARVEPSILDSLLRKERSS